MKSSNFQELRCILKKKKGIFRTSSLKAKEVRITLFPRILLIPKEM